MPVLLSFKQGDWKNALGYYQQASEQDPNNSHALLAIARVNQELQKYPDAKAGYEKLKAIDPELASQYAYLGEGKESGARATEVAAERKVVLWESGE